jgi:phosphoesterase RecJ-like protein
MSENGHRSSREEVLERLRAAERLILVTHERPDGDALGSLIATQEILTAFGKESVMFIDADEFPLPYEYRFLPLTGLITTAPADLASYTVVFLDCGNLDRNPAQELADGAALLNIDHHHDNTRFGTVNHVVPDASCTAEIVWDLMQGFGVVVTRTIAEALYVGLITDTGRFMYENTGTRAHLMAAELIEAGVDVHEIYHRVYEDLPYAKLALLARGLAKVERYDGGRLTLTSLSASDFIESGAEESHSEGVIDHLRAIQGTAVAALVRERVGADEDGPRIKVSLRSSDERIDVSAIARAQGGGGHRAAAGFSSDLSAEELVAFLRAEVAAQSA